MLKLFNKFANLVLNASGNPYAFLVAFVLIMAWALTGPAFNYSANWQLVVNTGTTIITFLMVFIIQYSQNKDTKAMQVKLDELIKSHETADNNKIAIEELTQKEIIEIAGTIKSGTCSNT